MRLGLETRKFFSTTALVFFSFTTPFAPAQADNVKKTESLEVGAIAFTCIQTESIDSTEKSNLIVVQSRSSARIPSPDPTETCGEYILRLMETGTSGNSQNAPPFPPSGSCDELYKWWRPPSAQSKEYKNCMNYILYGWW